MKRRVLGARVREAMWGFAVGRLSGKGWVWMMKRRMKGGLMGGVMGLELANYV